MQRIVILLVIGTFALFVNAQTSVQKEAVIDLVPERLAEGKIVRLGEFGSFSVSLSSEGVEKAEEFTAANIKSNSLNFRPGKLVQNVLDGAEYKKASE